MKACKQLREKLRKLNKKNKASANYWWAVGDAIADGCGSVMRAWLLGNTEGLLNLVSQASFK